MAIATFKRYEKKYLITKEMLDRILPSMLEYMELDPFCLNGNEYRIYSIYYDTDNHDVIRQNSSGPVYKEKMRIRSYYDRKDPEDKIFMEIKKKSEGQGNKRRIKLKIKEIEPFVNEGILPKGAIPSFMKGPPPAGCLRPSGRPKGCVMSVRQL